MKQFIKNNIGTIIIFAVIAILLITINIYTIPAYSEDRLLVGDDTELKIDITEYEPSVIYQYNDELQSYEIADQINVLPGSPIQLLTIAYKPDIKGSIVLDGNNGKGFWTENDKGIKTKWTRSNKDPNYYIGTAIINPSEIKTDIFLSSRKDNTDDINNSNDISEDNGINDDNDANADNNTDNIGNLDITANNDSDNVSPIDENDIDKGDNKVSNGSVFNSVTINVADLSEYESNTIYVIDNDYSIIDTKDINAFAGSKIRLGTILENPYLDENGIPIMGNGGNGYWHVVDDIPTEIEDVQWYDLGNDKWYALTTFIPNNNTMIFMGRLLSTASGLGDNENWDPSISSMTVIIMEEIPNEEGIYIYNTNTESFIKPDTLHASYDSEIELFTILDAPESEVSDNEKQSRYNESTTIANFEANSIFQLNNQQSEDEDTSWEQIGDKIIARTVINIPDEETFSFSYENEENQKMLNTLDIAVDDKILVERIELGPMVYEDIDIHTATMMENPNTRTALNREDNPYIVYVGEELLISYPEGYSTNIINENQAFTAIQRNTKDEREHLSMIGFHPCDAQIQLLNSSGIVEETMYVEVTTPIYVETTVGLRNQYYIREYYSCNASDSVAISTPSGDGIYIYNTYSTDLGLPFSITTVTLDRNRSFSYDSSVLSASPASINEKNGFYYITQKFTPIDSKTTNITFNDGTDEGAMFSVAVYSADAGHFDLEKEDGAIFIEEFQTLDSTGKASVVRNTYSLHVNSLGKMTAYKRNDSNNDEELLTWSSSSYKTLGGSKQTQYEYDTDQTFISGNGGRTSDTIKRVDFEVNLDLTPLHQTIDGVIIPGFENSPKIEGYETVIHMGPEDIRDANNRCPRKSGLDFVIYELKDTSEFRGGLSISKQVVNNPEANKDKSFDFSIVLSGTYTDAITGNRLSANNLTETISGIEFTNGKANISLKGGETININGIPAGITYKITETNVAGYNSSIDKPTGTIIGAEIVSVTAVNTYSISPITITPKVFKTLEGTSLEANRFDFEMSITGDPSDGFTAPSNLTAKNDASGNVIFQNITIKKPGTYTITVTEKCPPTDRDNITYDRDKTITITYHIIMDANGRLVVETGYPAYANGIDTFNNVYSHPFALPSSGGKGVAFGLLGLLGIIIISCGIAIYFSNSTTKKHN